MQQRPGVHFSKAYTIQFTVRIYMTKIHTKFMFIQISTCSLNFIPNFLRFKFGFCLEFLDRCLLGIYGCWRVVVWALVLRFGASSSHVVIVSHRFYSKRKHFFRAIDSLTYEFMMSIIYVIQLFIHLFTYLFIFLQSDGTFGGSSLWLFLHSHAPFE